MDLAAVLFVVVCGIGTLNSALLASYLALHRRGRRALNVLLAVLVLTFTLRVTKAVVLLFHGPLHPVLELLWIGGLASTGVAALLYALALAGRTDRRSLVLTAGAVAALGVVLAFATLPPRLAWRLMGMALAVYAGCATVALPLLVQARRRALPGDRAAARWPPALAAFLGAIWLLHLAFTVGAQFARVNEDAFFQVEAIAFSLGVYVLVYLELRLGFVARIHPAGSREAVAPDDPMLQRVRRAVEGERLFLDPSLSLPSLADRVKLSPQHVSRLINAGIGASFTDYVNRLRVEEAKRLLALPDGAARKIGALAFDCGFRSPSVFYAAFRKFTGQTPSDYLKSTARS